MHRCIKYKVVKIAITQFAVCMCKRDQLDPTWVPERTKRRAFLMTPDDGVPDDIPHYRSFLKCGYTRKKK